MSAPRLGIVEGYFGKPWSWPDRTAVMERLAPAGYRDFLYAPKADARLRRDWRTAHAPQTLEAMAAFTTACATAGVTAGVGLSPIDLLEQGDADGAFEAKLKALAGTGFTHLALFFDDMKGDTPGLSAAQIAWAKRAADFGLFASYSFCPTYYSDDSVLDRVFGARPEAYLEEIGRGLDSAVAIFWTGSEVCAREFSRAKLRALSQTLGRKPLLWDNYPVNDGPRMSDHLHLRGFTGRRAWLAEETAGHFINPALQPHLSCIPALSLSAAYREGADYDYAQAGFEAAYTIFGAPLAEALRADVLSLQDAGLSRLSPERIAALRAKYEALGGSEVVRFLDGAYKTTAEEVQTQ
jgi:hyaluronoglucosaminidase